MNYDSIEARLLRNSVPDPSTGCWVWLGKANNAGYGQLTVRDSTKPSPVNVYAHRMAVVCFQGKKLKPGHHVDHICRNTRCINPEHLRQVKGEINLGRRRVARASSALYCARCGQTHGVGKTCAAA